MSFLLIANSLFINAQLVQIEGTVGFNKSGVTQFSSIPIGKESKVHINVLAFFQKYHLEEDFFLDESGFQTTVLRSINKSFSIGPTVYFNSIAGLMSNATLSYVNVKKKYTLVMNSSAGYSSKQHALLGEFFFQGEYRIPIHKEWSIISYIQMLTNWIELKSHNRSFQKLRVGLSKNNWQFGLSSDFDQYGNAPIKRTTLGAFIRKTNFKI